MDLDLPPSKRWSALITDKKTEVRMLSSSFVFMADKSGSILKPLFLNSSYEK